ncbi:abscission/NoCut checkpoint regulator [Gastrophryne carolinensis]
MDGRCFSCASKFSIFKKECGCKSCGRAFCSGCLPCSAVLPSHGNSKQKICKKCYEAITSGVNKSNNSSKWSPPENYKKRVAALEAKQNQPKVTNSGPGMSHGINPKYQNLSPEDRAIAERLEKLKQDTKPKAVSSTADIESRVKALRKDTQGPVPSLQEMEDRLARLQGRTPPSKASKPIHQPPDTRTQMEKAEDLLTQLKAEVAIDQQCDPYAQSQVHLGISVYNADPTELPMNDLSKTDELDGRPVMDGELDAEQLEREKDRILREAAMELQDDNTRQEKMLEIAKRLAVLQGKDPDQVTVDGIKQPDSEEETEEEAVQRILKQLAEEAALDEASGYNIPPSQGNLSLGSNGASQAGKKPYSSQTHKVPAQPQPARSTAVNPPAADSDDEELPWCCICNADAVLCCHGCDDDLYCKRCFREGHDEYDRKEHQTSSYRPPQKRKGR